MRKLRLLLTSVTVVVCLIMALSAVPASAEPGDVTVTVRAPEEAAYNENITVYLDITEVTDFTAATVKVEYDDKVLEFVDCSDGDLSGATLDVSCTTSLGGEISVTIWGGLAPGPSGEGYLMDLVFRVIGEPCQNSPIDISGTMAHSDMSEITAEWVGSSVCVSNPREVESYNGFDERQDVFYCSQDVFIKGSGFAASTSYDVWVVPYEECTHVKEGDVLNTLGGPGKVATITTEADGSIPLTSIWTCESPLCETNFYGEIVVSENGIFNGADDGLDACCCDEWGVNCTPELPTAALFGIGLIGLVGVSGYMGLRRNRADHRVDQAM